MVSLSSEHSRVSDVTCTTSEVGRPCWQWWLIFPPRWRRQCSRTRIQTRDRRHILPLYQLQHWISWNSSNILTCLCLSCLLFEIFSEIIFNIYSISSPVQQWAGQILFQFFQVPPPVLHSGAFAAKYHNLPQTLRQKTPTKKIFKQDFTITVTAPVE